MVPEAIKHYIAREIWDYNSAADRVHCAVNAASEYYSYAKTLKTLGYSGDLARDLNEFGDNQILLSKLIIVAHSRLAPDGIKNDLMAKAKAYPAKYIPYYLDYEGEDIISRKNAKIHLRNLRKASKLIKVMGAFNYVLTCDADGFAIAKGKDKPAQDVPEIFKKTQKSLMDEEKIKILHDAYEFLASFDPDLANSLREKDAVIKGMENYHRSEEGICGLSCHEFIKHYFLCSYIESYLKCKIFR